jgi:hypothetical protein
MSSGVNISASSNKDDEEFDKFGKKKKEIDNPELWFVIMVLEPCMMRNKPIMRSLSPQRRGPCFCSSRRRKTKMMKNQTPRCFVL